MQNVSKRALQGVERWMVLCAFKCKRFRNTRHTVTFGTPLQISF
jgi:hypothetical protein